MQSPPVEARLSTGAANTIVIVTGGAGSSVMIAIQIVRPTILLLPMVLLILIGGWQPQSVTESNAATRRKPSFTKMHASACEQSLGAGAGRSFRRFRLNLTCPQSPGWWRFQTSAVGDEGGERGDVAFYAS